MDSGDELPAAMRAATDAALAATEALGDRFDRGPEGRLRYVLNPRFILSCSDPLWEGIRDLAGRRGWPIHTHALEQRDETEAVRQLKGGRDEIEYFAEQGVLAADLRLAHGVWLTAAHLTRVRHERFSVVHCPSSNLKLGSGIADLVAIIGSIGVISASFGFDKMIARFTTDGLLKKAAVFDPQKLDWMNGVYLRQMPERDLAELIAKQQPARAGWRLAASRARGRCAGA